MQTSTKRPAPTFVIRLVGGPDLRPDRVPWRPLSRIFNAVQRVVEHTEKDEAPDTEPIEGISGPRASSIQLLDVLPGSAAYPFAAVDGTSALKILSDMGCNLSRPATAEWDSASLSSIDDISAAARAIGVTVEIRKERKDGEVLATITPRSYAEVSEGVFVTSDSSVFGFLERVGGATDMRCALRLPRQSARLVYCRVETDDMIRELGRHIYESVKVSGPVTWFRRSWLVKSINVRSVEPAKTGSILEALDRIYEAGGKAWDEVEDPDEFIAEIRRS